MVLSSFVNTQELHLTISSVNTSSMQISKEPFLILYILHCAGLYSLSVGFSGGTRADVTQSASYSGWVLLSQPGMKHLKRTKKYTQKRTCDRKSVVRSAIM